MKDILLSTGLDRLARLALGGEGVILGLHRVYDPRPTKGWSFLSGLEISTQNLIDTIECLKQEQYEIVPLAEVPGRMAYGGGAGRFACLTFDDGYRDNLQNLLPVLERYQAPATIFLTTGFLRRSHAAWWLLLDEAFRRFDEIPLTLPEGRVVRVAETAEAKTRIAIEVADRMRTFDLGDLIRCVRGLEELTGATSIALTEAAIIGSEDVARLARHPLIEIGAHGVTHRPLARLSAEDARREMALSRADLEYMTGQTVRLFAYPYGGEGDVTARDAALARELGFKIAVSSIRGPVGRDPDLLMLNRVPLDDASGGRYTRLGLSGLNAAHWSIA